MSHRSIVCEHCGAVCNEDDGYCKNCWKKLTPASGEAYILEGAGHSQWADFIDKNKERYMRVFQKNEGKTVFVGWNWAGFVFGLNWMFYRKMYKTALICYLILYVLSLLVVPIVALPYIPALRETQQQIEICEEYIDKGLDNKLVENADGELCEPRVAKNHYEQDLLSMEITIMLWSMLIIAVMQPILIALFGDALYKAHVKKNMLTQTGGVSLASYFGGVLVFDWIQEIVSFAVLMLLMVIL